MPKRSFRIGRSATGLGMFAVKPIKRRAHIVAYRGPLLTEEEAVRREARDARYLFILNSKWTIDGSPRWNLARYINHSCWPNAEPITRNGGIVIVAARRIEPEEEITYDYGPEYRDYFFKGRRRCLCQPCRETAARRRRKKMAAQKMAGKKTTRKKTSNTTMSNKKTARKKTAKRKSR
jgi:SET domain-containing protein